ncbi:alpha/beta hydrolase [Myceligenerans crystallogenes]|uniref:Alpha/beta hydrolase n=1 Tax=Myceligenerans crystallogenes TaxID=316335 RepID=A0ABN2NH74_9MICO
MTSPNTVAPTVDLTVTSADGTAIAVDRTGPGGGPSVVVVDGVLAHRPAATRAIARVLALPVADDDGGHFRGPISCVRYDRRGRGESGFRPPYAVEREIEDLSAVLDVAERPAALLGLSTGSFLALRAAADLGERVTAVVVHRPRYDVAAADPYAWRHLVAAVESCVAEGDRGSAVELFLDVAGIPPGYVAGMRRCPSWADLEAHAPTIAHDGRIVTAAPAALTLPQHVETVTGEGPAAIVTAVRRAVAAVAPADPRPAVNGP